MELIAAVQKCGEGNWANILKADFKGDRTASQLSQRWAIIRKRHGNMVGNDSQLSEAQLAARHAMSLAFGDNLRAARPISTNGGPNSGGGPGISSRFTAADIASGGPQSKHQQDLVPPKPIISKNPLSKPAIVNPDPFARAAAMAASSRIATPSSAAAMAASSRIATSSSAVASLQKAAQSKKVVHIMPGGTPAVKSSVPGSTNGLPSNVHFIRTGLVSRPPGPSNASQSMTQHLQGHSLRSASPAVQPKPTLALPSRTNASSGTPSTLTSTAAGIQENQTVVQPNLRGEKAEVIRDASLANTPQQQVPKDRTFGSGNLSTEKVEGQTSVLGVSVKELAGESKASSIHVQEKLIPSQETLSNKNENTKIELAVKNTVRR